MDSLPKASSGRSVVAAGFWRRTAALLIDLAVIVPVSWIFAVILRGVLGLHFPPTRHEGPDYWVDVVLAAEPALVVSVTIALVIAALYLFLFQLLLGQTLGMRLLRLQIIDSYGDQPNLWRALVRTLGYFLCLGTLNLGFLWAGFDRQRRGLHDWISGTYVIRNEATGTGST